MPGPAKTPTQVKLNRGSWRGKSEAKTAPPRLVGDFSCPKHLKLEAKRFWEKLMPDLVRIGVISKTELDMFAMLCETWADYKKACKDHKGDYRLKKMLRDEVIKYAAHFGLTPSTRSNVRAFDNVTDSGTKERFFKIG